MTAIKRILNRAGVLIILGIICGAMLSACGDSPTATTQPAPAPTTAAATTQPSAGTTQAATTQAATTAANVTMTAAGSGATTAATTAVATADPNDTGATISFWIRESQRTVTDPLIAGYNSTHKNQVKVTYIPSAEFLTKFGTAVAGGQAPDVVSVDLTLTPVFSSANQLTDITDLSKALPFYDKLSPSHLRLATYNNRLYGLPFAADASVLIYNKDLFKQAGLDPEKPPTNWDGIMEASKKITALGNGIYGYYFAGACGGCNAFTLLPLIWASGGDVLNSDGTQATFSDPKIKDAFNFYQQLWAAKQVPAGAKADSWSDFTNAFTTGKIGMVLNGSTAVATLKTKFPNIDFGVAPIPGETSGTSSFAGGDNITIPKGSKHVNEAFDFMSWCLTDNAQVEYRAKNAGLPVRTDLASNKYSQQDPRYIILANALAQGRTPYSTKTSQLFNDANGPWLAAFQKAVFDGKVDEALSTAQDQFTKILSSK